MSYHNGPKVVTPGIVAYFDAKNLKSYSGSGTTWSSLSGGYIATKGGTQSPTYPQFNSGGWFNFTGGTLGTNYTNFTIPSIPSFSELSVFVWYRTSNTSDNKTILRMNNSDFELSINGSTSVYAAAGTNYNDVGVNATQANATDGNWHNVGLTFTGTVLKSYFDTAQIATTTRASSTTTAAGTLNIGTRDDAYYQHFVGDISIVLLYSRILSDSEIAQNYNALKGRHGI